jgi:hypothetical protein
MATQGISSECGVETFDPKPLTYVNEAAALEQTMP